jgi:2-dehydropantoate 2-reductase
MRFVVLGAGGVGGVIGGRLFEHGHEVVLIARGAHRDKIREEGLRLESPDSSVTLAIPVVADPGEVEFRGDDIVLLAVKSQDTAAAINALAWATPADVAVVCVQNGVENERVALRAFPNVYGICVMLPTTHLIPGVVQAHSTPTTGILDVGRYPSGVDETAETVAAALRASTFSSEAKPDIARWKYAKLLANLGNAIEAVCGPSARQGPLAKRTREEGVACLRAAGVEFASDDEDTARRGALLRLRPIGGQRRRGGSSWQSLTKAAGSVETDYLNGEIALLGRLVGVPTPLNTALQHHANRMAHERRPPGSMSEEEFWRSLDSPIG